MHGRRRDHIAAIASRIDAGTDPTGRRRNRPGVSEPQVAAAASGDEFARRWQRAKFFFKRAQARFTMLAVDIEHPESGNRSGRNPDVAIWNPPKAADRFGVGRGGMETAANGRLLRTWLARKD